MNMNHAKMFEEITVIDPDTKGEVQVSMFKHQNGGIFGIDSSFIDQVLSDQEGDCFIPDPFNDEEITMVMLEGV